MQNKALVVIDIQNDITKNYREIVDKLDATWEQLLADNCRYPDCQRRKTTI